MRKAKGLSEYKHLTKETIGISMKIPVKAKIWMERHDINMSKVFRAKLRELGCPYIKEE